MVFGYNFNKIVLVICSNRTFYLLCIVEAFFLSTFYVYRRQGNFNWVCGIFFSPRPNRTTLFFPKRVCCLDTRKRNGCRRGPQNSVVPYRKMALRNTIVSVSSSRLKKLYAHRRFNSSSQIRISLNDYFFVLFFFY